MDDYTSATYGDRIAEIYDEYHALKFESSVEGLPLLADLAGDGHALELGIGTGRVALPLAERGVQIHGVDISEAIVDKLRAKPGGDAIPVNMGDLADVPVQGHFRLIFIVFNTFFALLTQDEQVRCFRNVAAHLEPGGAFLMEAFVPDVTRFDRHQRTETTNVGTDLVIVRSLDPLPGRAARRIGAPGPARPGYGALPRTAPLRLSARTRPDGAPCRPATTEPLGRLGTDPVLAGSRAAHLDMGEARMTA
ncbi:MAG: class I SAM-dependent methyltransferase [Actinomycetota bacterium]